MSSLLKGKQASKATPQLEWQSYDNEAEWQSHQGIEAASDDSSQAVQRSHWLGRHWRTALVILALLTVAGGWTWYQAQKGVAQIQVELEESAQADLWRTPKEAQMSNGALALADLEAIRPVTSTLQLLSLTGDVAIVRLTMQPGPEQAALRQTRLYQRAEGGWQRIAPSVTLWGSPRRRQTEYFDFQYYAQDEEAVTAVATIIDSLYAGLTINFLPANFDASNHQVKIGIEVNPTQAYASIAARQHPDAPLVVASPATYLAPVNLSESQLLAQSIFLSLLKESQARALQRYKIPARWQALVADLHLWQSWQLELPLAVWRKPLQRWIVAALDQPQTKMNVNQPAFAAQLCAMHHLWMRSPLAIQIPLSCENQSSAGTWPIIGQGAEDSPFTLSQLIPIAQSPLGLYPAPQAYPGADLVLTTLFDYIAATYGKERLPLLVETLHEHPSWETLAPAIFGLSATEFEEGWRHYLVQEYGVVLGK